MLQGKICQFLELLRFAFWRLSETDAEAKRQEVAKSICLDDALWQLLADFWQSFGINVFSKQTRTNSVNLCSEIGPPGVIFDRFWSRLGLQNRPEREQRSELKR